VVSLEPNRKSNLRVCHDFSNAMLCSAVLVIMVYTNLQLVSASRMRSVMLTYILPESRPKIIGMHISMC